MSRPIRVLHVLGSLGAGGIEVWLSQVVKETREDVSHYFFLSEATPGLLDEDLSQQGCKIHRGSSPHSPLAYALSLSRFIRTHRIDVVHSHLHFFSGFVLHIARLSGIKHRIAHSHNDTRAVDAAAGLLRRAYLLTMSRWLNDHATHGLACSRHAASSMFGSDWESDGRWSLLPYGIDLRPFLSGPTTAEMRASLQLPARGLVLGHVGRFVPQKNHAFLLRIAKACFDVDTSASLLLVGDGPLRGSVESLAEQLGIRERVVFLGLRRDVAEIMLGALDVLLLPSRHEGLGLVLVEAQAAGLPCVVADTIPPEATVLPELVATLGLGEAPSTWAKTAHEMSDRRMKPVDAVSRIQGTQSDLRSSSSALATYYRSLD